MTNLSAKVKYGSILFSFRKQLFLVIVLLFFTSAFQNNRFSFLFFVLSGEFDVLTLVFVLIFVISFIIVFCIICYLRNRTDNNRNFQRLLINPARDTETGQNRDAFFVLFTHYFYFITTTCGIW